MNYQFYKNAIISYLPASKIRPDGEFLLAINFARREISHIFDPIIEYFSFQTIPNQQEYDLSSLLGVSYFLSVSKILNATCKIDTFQYQLKKFFKEEIVFTYSGIPFFYYYYNNIFGLYPIPVDEYTITIKLSRIPDDLTSASSEIDNLKPFIDLIILLACEKMAMYLGNAELANYFRTLFDNQKIVIKTQFR